MRLIDADAIPYCNYDLDNYHSFRAVEDTVIDEMPTIDPVKHDYVPIEVVRQIQWERDIAMSYLEEAGIGFGEKAELQRVKHGKWISHEGYEECNLCYGKVTFPYNYCPNCGAKMDK